MSAVRSKFYHIDTRLGELHQLINNNAESKFRECAERHEIPTERLAALENTINQLSISRKDNGASRSENLANVIIKSRDYIHVSTDPPPYSDLFRNHIFNLSWLVSAKASVQTIAAVLEVLSGNVVLLNQEIQYWEDVLEFDWRISLYTLQTSPSRAWQRCVRPADHSPNDTLLQGSVDDIPEARARPGPWLQFYATVQRCIFPELRSFKIGLCSSLSGSKSEIERKRRKLQATRDFNASAIGILAEECLSLEAVIHAPHSDEIADHDLIRTARVSVGLMNLILRNNGQGIESFERPDSAVKNGGSIFSEPQKSVANDLIEPQAMIRELIHILTNLLPRYRRASAERITEFGRPSAAVRYWLPLSLTLISGTTLLKIARNIGPVLLESISNFGATAIDFWKNWVVEPMRKLVRTIRHDEKSDIALMSKNSLEADRASLERMVVDFVIDRGGQSQPTSSADSIADKVREGDLTPVLKAYEKDLRSPFVGTLRGDLVRALLIQIQKTKVDVEVAMSGIDALLRSQELVFGFIGLTPGLLISYASIRWLLGLAGNRRGFRMGKRQDGLRYALRKIHRIISSSKPTKEGRLTYKNHGLLICNIDVLLSKGQILLKGEDLRAFHEDSCDLVNEKQAEKQLQIVERMAWTYSKWT